jgi:SAM-dependent methyltransferase
MNSEVTFGMTFTVNFDRLRSGNSYGVVLCQNLLGSFPYLGTRRDLRICESGPGIGLTSSDFLLELSRQRIEFKDYRGVDLAPNLIKASYLNQLKQQGHPVRYIQGDAHKLDSLIEEESVDIFIANEMGGDLLTVGFTPKELAGESHKYAKEVNRLKRAHDISLPKDVDVFNLGSWYLIESISRILRRGGVAFFSEHSCESEKPVITKDPPDPVEFIVEGKPSPIDLSYRNESHTEYSIQFSALEQIAVSCGLEVSRGKLIDFADLKPDGSSIFFKVLEFILRYHKVSKTKFEEIAKTDLFPGGARNFPVLANIYLHEHPGLLKQILRLDDGKFNRIVKPFLIPSRDFHAQFEYLSLRKPD